MRHLRFIVPALAVLCIGAVIRANTPDVAPETSLSLDTVVAEAVAGPMVEAAKARWEAAREGSTIARSWPDPMLTYGYYTSSVQTRVGPMNQKVTFAQKVPFPGKLADAGDLAAKQALVAMWQYRAAARQAIRQAKTLYFALYQVDASARIIREQQTLLDQVIETAKSGFEAGSANLQDVLKARLARDELSNRLTDLGQQRAGLAARLNALCAGPAGAPVPSVRTLPPLSPPPGEGALLAFAETHRQELQMADAAVARDRVALVLARKDRDPDFTVGVDYTQINRSDMANIPDSGKDASMIFFSLNLPWHRAKLRAEERRADRQLAASRAQLADAHLEVESDVRDAWAQARGFREQIALYRRSLLPQAEDTYKASSVAYAAGKIGLIGVLDSERTLLALRLGLVMNEAKLGQALAALERAVGADLSRLSGTPSSTDRHAQAHP